MKNKQQLKKTYLVATATVVAVAVIIYGVVQLAATGLVGSSLKSYFGGAGKDVGSISAIARVNSEVITNHDLLVRQKIYFLENNMNETPALLADTHDTILKMLMTERLQSQFADESGAPDYREDAEAQLERVAAQNKQTRAQMVARMEQRGISEENITNYIAATIRWQSVLFGFINQAGVVTPVDVNEKINSKKRLIGKHIYKAIMLQIKRPDKSYVKEVMTLLQRNPSGWQNALATDLQSGRIIMTERADMRPQEFGEPFASQLLQQKSAIPPGSTLGPRYSSNNQLATIYVLQGGGVVPKMNLDQLKQSIEIEAKERTLKPIDEQLKNRLWREAIIEKL